MKIATTEDIAQYLDAVTRYKAVLYQGWPALKRKAGKRALEAAITHKVCTMSMGSLVDLKRIGLTTILRLVETESGAEPIFFDMEPTGGEPRVGQAHTEAAQNAQYLDVYRNVFEKYKGKKPVNEIKTLIIQGMHLEFVWVAYSDRDKDIFIPARKDNKWLKKNKYTRRELVALFEKWAKLYCETIDKTIS